MSYMCMLNDIALYCLTKIVLLQVYPGVLTLIKEHQIELPQHRRIQDLMHTPACIVVYSEKQNHFTNIL